MTDRDAIELLNRVVAQPEVLSKVAPGYLSLDLTAFFDNPANIMFGDDRGVVMFVSLGEGLYDMHYLLTSALRGRNALYAIKTAISALFTYHGARAITGATPRDNCAARAVNRALGGHPIGVSEDSLGRPCINYMLERSTWVRLSGA